MSYRIGLFMGSVARRTGSLSMRNGTVMQRILMMITLEDFSGIDPCHWSSIKILKQMAA
jgi:hypothetical protein